MTPNIELRPGWHLWLALMGLLLAACGGAPRADAHRVYPDAAAMDHYQRWLAAGERPVSLDASQHALQGLASWYGPGFEGRATASGEPFDKYGQTAAHRSLPFGSIVRVRRPDTRQFVVVRINDRGPFVSGRVIDLSYGAALDLDMIRQGVVPVEVDVIHLGDGRRWRKASAATPSAVGTMVWRPLALGLSAPWTLAAHIVTALGFDVGAGMATRPWTRGVPNPSLPASPTFANPHFLNITLHNPNRV